MFSVCLSVCLAYVLTPSLLAHVIIDFISMSEKFFGPVSVYSQLCVYLAETIRRSFPTLERRLDINS